MASKKKALIEQGLNLAHRLEKKPLPSEARLKDEHMHMAQHEKELRALLTPVNLARVEDLGVFSKGGVKPIPRVRRVKTNAQ